MVVLVRKGLKESKVKKVLKENKVKLAKKVIKGMMVIIYQIKNCKIELLKLLLKKLIICK